mgnify:CR=1 FL=1
MTSPLAQLQPSGEGIWALHGPVTFDTVPRLWPRGLALSSQGGAVQVDLAKVQSIDSAGLALLLAWRGRAQSKGGHLDYRNVPARLLALADLTDSREVLLAALP